MDGLRLSPGILSRLARIAPDRDLGYDQWVIPAGTPVGMTAALMHRDERVYSDLERFEPERWMDLDAKKRQERSYGPFSRGTRTCLGMHLAWAELYMMMAMVVSRFDIEFVDTGPEEVTPYSDNFLIATKSKKSVKAKVKLAES